MSHRNGKQRRSLSLIFLRSHVLREQEGRCCWCRLPVAQRKATLEHLVPRSKGGRANRGNVAVACLECNSARGDGEGWPDTTRFGPARVRELLEVASAAEAMGRG